MTSIEFHDLRNWTQTLRIEVAQGNDDVLAGGQGRVYRVKELSPYAQCIKAVPGVSAAEFGDEIKPFVDLLGDVDRRIAKEQAKPDTNKNAVLKCLLTFRKYLPTHAAWKSITEDEEPTLLLLRRWCDGQSLKDLDASVKDKEIDKPGKTTRHEIAKRVTRLLTTLDLCGYVHLDPYPDNIFITDIDKWRTTEVSLIDLEGIGVLKKSNDGRISYASATFSKLPSAYGKQAFWIRPWWFPSPGETRASEDRYIAAARWQMLCLALFVLTWGGSPFASWLPPDARTGDGLRDRRDFTKLAELNKQLTKTGDWGLDIQRAYEALSGVLSRIANQADDSYFELKFAGNAELRQRFISWTHESFVDPRKVPSARNIQTALAKREAV